MQGMITQRTILIPIDFRVASLSALSLALEQTDEPTVRVVLLYCESLDNSITELLFYSPERTIDDLLTRDFRDALTILLNRFENTVDDLRIELFHGHAQRAFDALLDTLQIDAVYVAKSYRLHLAGRAFDPMPYIRKSNVPHYELTSDRPHLTAEQDKLENLFM